jgi:hypothetical protein
LSTYNPTNWYWTVAGDEGKMWSSAKAAWVAPDDAALVQFLAQGGFISRVGSWAELETIFATDFPAGSLQTYLPAKRYDVEVAGINVGGAMVATDRQSQSMIANAFSYVVASGAPYVTYKADSGWVTLTAEQIRGVALAVGQHVQSCFSKEAQIALAISTFQVTTREQIDAFFLAPTLPDNPAPPEPEPTPAP